MLLLGIKFYSDYMYNILAKPELTTELAGKTLQVTCTWRSLPADGSFIQP